MIAIQNKGMLQGWLVWYLLIAGVVAPPLCVLLILRCA